MLIVRSKSQFTEWFLYVLLVFVIATLLTEIIYLNVSLCGINVPDTFIVLSSRTAWIYGTNNDSERHRANLCFRKL